MRLKQCIMEDVSMGVAIFMDAPRKVGYVGLLLYLFKSRFIHGTYENQGVGSFELIRMQLQFV